jgi:hypothetical protein
MIKIIEELVNASQEQQGEDDKDEQHINVAFEATAFNTYQVNAISYQRFKST